jgi:hypothetical protein
MREGYRQSMVDEIGIEREGALEFVDRVGVLARECKSLPVGRRSALAAQAASGIRLRDRHVCP